MPNLFAPRSPLPLTHKHLRLTTRYEVNGGRKHKRTYYVAVKELGDILRPVMTPISIFVEFERSMSVHTHRDVFLDHLAVDYFDGELYIPVARHPIWTRGVRDADFPAYAVGVRIRRQTFGAAPKGLDFVGFFWGNMETLELSPVARVYVNGLLSTLLNLLGDETRLGLWVCKTRKGLAAVHNASVEPYHRSYGAVFRKRHAQSARSLVPVP